jgi:hypothetical protein
MESALAITTPYSLTDATPAASVLRVSVLKTAAPRSLRRFSGFAALVFARLFHGAVALLGVSSGGLGAHGEGPFPAECAVMARTER